MQKYVSLQLNPGQLISNGFFQRTRNINYFGELLIYAGFGLLAMHWLPIAIVISLTSWVEYNNIHVTVIFLTLYPWYEKRVAPIQVGNALQMIINISKKCQW
jgi:steroid 5-alpha reductase family enzyme